MSGKGLARLDPEDMKALNAVLGDLIEISGEKKTVARITGTFQESYGKKVIQIDGITRGNAKANLGEMVRIRKISRQTADNRSCQPPRFYYRLARRERARPVCKSPSGITGDRRG